MKKLFIFFLLFSVVAIAQQEQTRDLKNLKNQNNDKYMDRDNYHSNQQVIVCESNGNRRTHCPADTRYGVNFNQQLSYATCNYNWGYDQTGIWVDNGCRAEFTVNYGWDQPGADENIFVCESHGYNRTYCPAYLDGREVQLLRQLSYTSCHNNWGFDRNGVWVTNGCRAEFVVNQSHWGTPQDDIVYCSSNDMRFQSCDVDVRGGVEFIRQLSRASCNGNWGYDRQGIWVRNGCRAKFRILPFNNNNNGYMDDTVSCASRDMRRNSCPADTSGGVRLKKQHSRSSCEGNWGYDRNSIWVDNGCRATFQLYINGRGGHHGNYGHGNNYGNGPGYNNNPGHNNNGYNNTLICSSLNNRRNTCAITSGRKVKLKRQLSSSSCQGNWGYDRNNIWVDNGCRAEFEIH